MASTSNVITLTSAHNFTTGEKVTLQYFNYNGVSLSGRFFYVKVIDSYNVSLYYDSNLSISLNLANVTFSAAAQIVPVQYTPAPTYNSCVTYTLDGRGILSRNTQNVTISTNSLQQTVDTTTLSSYIAGVTDVVITVSPGVYVYSDNNAIAGLTIGNFIAGDTVKLTNNGYIMGRGGTGASGNGAAGVGGPAMNIFYPITLTNNSYIAGGGGGGGGTRDGPSGATAGGGGGAGGGTGGNGFGVSGGAGGGPGASGGSGTSTNNLYGVGHGGGGGGRILPGTGGGGNGGGGGAGGGGGNYSNSSGGSGGGGTSTGSGGSFVGGGGGGGWSAAGGNGVSGGPAGRYSGSSGGAGGKAINLNGYSITYVTTGTIYGAVS